MNQADHHQPDDEEDKEPAHSGEEYDAEQFERDLE